VKLDRYSKEKLKKELLAIVGKHLNLKDHRVFFYGSRVSGKSNDRSDIDVGIEGPKPIPPKILLSIIEEVESIPPLYKIEVVDFSQVDQKFKEVALQNIELFNK